MAERTIVERFDSYSILRVKEKRQCLKPLALTIIIFLVSATCIVPLTIKNVNAGGLLPNTTPEHLPTWSVPIAWCALQGSPATLPTARIPSFIPGYPPSTTTDLILRDRNGRASFDIWLNQAGLMFQTAIPILGPNTHIIPIVPDPLGNSMLGGHTQGDVFPFGSLLSGSTFIQEQQIIDSCRTAWQHQHPAVGNNGIVAVNIKRFLIAPVFPLGFLSSPMLGEGGCRMSLIALTTQNNFRCTGGNQLMVVDNSFTFNGLPRDPHDIVLGAALAQALGQFAPPPPPPPGPLYSTGQHVGCGISLALNLILGVGACLLIYTSGGLSHPAGGGPPPPNALLNGPPSSLVSSSGTGIADNTLLLPQQKTFAREPNARSIPVTNMDPPNMTLSGDIVSTSHMANLYENKTIPNSLHLSGVEVSMNTTGNKVSFGQKLVGLVPFSVVPNDTKSTNPLQFWTLVDTDNNKKTGIGQKMLQEIGAPSGTKFTAADLVIKTVVVNTFNVTGTAWKLQDGKIVELPRKGVNFDVQRLFEFPIYSNSSEAGNAAKHLGFGTAINDMITTTIDNQLANISLDKPFAVQALTATISNNTGNLPAVVDKLDKTAPEQGATMVLQKPILNATADELKPLMLNTTK